MIKKINKKAFTLIEVIVVIAIVGILALLAIPRFMGHTQKAELVRVQHDVKAMEKEIGAKLINKDDEFNKWESNSKDLNQLVQDKELFEKEGVVKELDSTEGTYKVIPKEYKAKINTKLKGTFYANSGGKVYYEHTKPLVGIPTESEKEPSYSDEEIEDLIKHEYIPVATADELNNVRSATLETYGKGTKWEGLYTGGLNKKYIQVKNINLSVYSGEGWAPIGTSSASFKGTYDGGSYVITGLEVKGDGKNLQGLFGYTSGAIIENVALEDVNVTGTETGYYTGGLVGMAKDNTMISNSYATGSVAGGGYIGGLIGSAQYGTKISNSYFTGEVTGRENAGGLVGSVYSNVTISNSYTTGSLTGGGTYNGNVGGLVGWASANSTISNSYSTVDVTGTASNVGGLVGWAYSNVTIENSYATGTVTSTGTHAGGLLGEAAYKSTISNSYATGPVEGREYVGGLIGFLSSSTIRNSYSIGSATGLVTESDISGWNVGGLVGQAVLGPISNSYATGSVTGRNQVGGLVGLELTNNNTTMTSNSYWNKDTTGQLSSASGTGKSTAEMKLKETYKDWDFDTVWEITTGNYPSLK